MHLLILSRTQCPKIVSLHSKYHSYNYSFKKSLHSFSLFLHIPRHTSLHFEKSDLFQFLRFTRLRNMDRPVFSKSSHLSFSKYFLHRSSPFIPNVTKPIPLAKIHLLRLLVVKKRRFQSHSLFEPEPHARHTCHDTYFLPPSLPPARSPEHLSDTRTPTRVGKGLESWVYTTV